ncbi:NAD(P)/FAD-dependent oxidoreductase [Pendulispora brunnea]|uniref:NAD(P)/FAD-dependent oxidoreductase n=1 Tax=Pendulispora brunnea TaxID=2905690 RepID=A0ABZ2KHW9_9BACT
MTSYDVVIAGGGIAGAFLARQLKLERPSLSILVLEQAKEIDNLKVGESTVEVAAHYMITRLNLGTYLYQHQLPKNGLRFFFDNADKSLPLTRMSEIGSDHMPYCPSFQLERAALERDLVDLNRAIGIDVQLGAKVVEVAVGSPHRVVYQDGEQEGQRHEVRARWLCDATGRRQLLTRARGHKVHKEERLPTAAAWGRYRNVAGLDAPSDPEWRQRVRWTSRHLSTNHLMYDGYWIWFIPLAGDLMSVGVVYDKSRIGDSVRTRPAFEAFLREHRAVRDLMEGAVFEDFQAYAHLPYRSDVYFSEDRWALTGEAGAFTDPFYSPGSDFIATANEFIASMIASDLDGDAEAFRTKVGTYNDYYRFKYESTIRLYIDLYPIFGSYDVFRLKFWLDFNNYYNLVLWPFMAGKLRDIAFLRDELRFADRILMAQSTMARQFVALADKLRDSGEYFARNEGLFANGLDGVRSLEKRVGPSLDELFRRDQVQKNYGSVFARVLERFTGKTDLAAREVVLKELPFPAVVLWKDIDEKSVAGLFDRLGLRLKKELAREFPHAPIERVRVRDDLSLEITGDLDAEVRSAVEARAFVLWQTTVLVD